VNGNGLSDADVRMVDEIRINRQVNGSCPLKLHRLVYSVHMVAYTLYSRLPHSIGTTARPIYQRHTAL